MHYQGRRSSSIPPTHHTTTWDGRLDKVVKVLSVIISMLGGFRVLLTCIVCVEMAAHRYLLSENESCLSVQELFHISMRDLDFISSNYL